MWESYSCYPSFFCFGVLKFSLQHYQSAKTTEWRCKQMIVWFRDIIRSSISTGFTVLLLIFSAISSRLIWTIFLQDSWCIEINVELLHMFIGSSLTMHIFISAGVASCSLKSPQFWWENGIGVYRIQSITGNKICCFSLRTLILLLAKLPHEEHCFTPWMIVSWVQEAVPALHGVYRAAWQTPAQFPILWNQNLPWLRLCAFYSREQHGNVLIPQFPPHWIGQEREGETTQTVEHIFDSFVCWALFM